MVILFLLLLHFAPPPYLPNASAHGRPCRTSLACPSKRGRYYIGPTDENEEEGGISRRSRETLSIPIGQWITFFGPFSVLPPPLSIAAAVSTTREKKKKVQEEKIRKRKRISFSVSSIPSPPRRGEGREGKKAGPGTVAQEGGTAGKSFWERLPQPTSSRFLAPARA